MVGRVVAWVVGGGVGFCIGELEVGLLGLTVGRGVVAVPPASGQQVCQEGEGEVERTWLAHQRERQARASWIREQRKSEAILMIIKMKWTYVAHVMRRTDNR